MSYVRPATLRTRIHKVFHLAQAIRRARAFKPKEKKVMGLFLAALRTHDGDRIDKAIGRAFEVLDY